MAVDTLDFVVLAVILLATVAFFTRGSLWGKAGSEEDKFSSFGLNRGSENTRDIIEKLEQSDKNMVVFFGSQTGTAEDFASRLAKEASSRFGLKTMVADVEDYDLENLNTFPHDKIAAFVFATYGEGEPTDNATQFYEFITGEDVTFSGESEDSDANPLSKLNYIVFGLGNTTYEHYNAIGRGLDAALQRLGAHRIGLYGEGDDGEGTMDEDYLAWKEEMFSTLKAERQLEEHEAVYEPVLECKEVQDLDKTSSSVFLGEVNKEYLAGEPKAPYGASNPYLAPVVTTREIFNSDTRNCIHLELDISGSNLRYTTGDHLALWPQNSDEEVDRFLQIFGLLGKRHTVVDVSVLDPTAKVPFPTPTTYDTIVRHYLEINGPVSRQLVSSIAPFAPSDEAKKRAMALGGDRELHHAQVTAHFYNTARLLYQLSGGELWTNVPFSFIIETMGHLQPRYYSISSSSLVNKHLISITAVVESHRPASADHVLKGVATNYIMDVSNYRQGAPRPYPFSLEGPRGAFVVDEPKTLKIPVHVRRSNFKLPSSPLKPIIMVGPGTGVAPFRGFIHERAMQAANGSPIGRALLFYGSRSSKEDNLYSEEWIKYSGESGVDAALDASNFLQVVTAFSRETEKKVYVQHRLEEHGALVNQMLQQGAFFYVCGDAGNMARDVQNTLVRIIAEHRAIDLDKATAIIKSMKTQNLYQEDVW